MRNRKEPVIVTPYLLANKKLCTACWKCIGVCPKNVIGKVSFLWHKHITIINAQNCTGCNRCVAICPNSVIIPIPRY